MSRLFQWVKQASVQLADPGREERVDASARHLISRMKAAGTTFRFDEEVAAAEISQRDVPLVRRRVYYLALERAWLDGQLTERERSGLSWVAKAVALPNEDRKRLELEVGCAAFEKLLGAVLADGHLAPAEVQALSVTADAIGLSVRTLVRQYFLEWGEGFLRNAFAHMIQDGRLSEAEWARLVAACEALGFSQGELLTLLEPQSTRFVEHVLADAKADGKLSAAEESTLRWLLGNLQLPTGFSAYARQEVTKLRILSDANEGKLPVLSQRVEGLRAGESLHTVAGAQYLLTKQLRSGPRTECHEGELLITDVRLLFNCATKSFETPHRKVISLVRLRGGFELRTGAKGAGVYRVADDADVFLAIYNAAIRRANQTLTVSLEGSPSRHIPREVRQRVWQTYAGRCAQCQSDQYLEFDHVIPVAKGGGNGESNVQLLCRKCNLQKSDHI